MKGVLYMWKKNISLLLVFSFVLSLLILPANAYNTFNDETTQEITIYIPPKSSVPVPYGWIGSGSVIQYPLGSLTAGDWLYLTVTNNTSAIPIIVQLYTDYGAGYAAKPITVGTCGWEVKVSASHYLLLTNDNNYGTEFSFYITY